MLNRQAPPAATGEAGSEGRGTRADLMSLVSWLVIVGVALFFLPLFLTVQTIRAENDRLALSMDQVQVAAATEPTLRPAALQLQATQTQVSAQIEQLKTVATQLAAGYLDWPKTLALVSKYDPTRIVLTGVSQTENRLVLSGHASDDTAVVSYAGLLESSDYFSRVVVQSIISLPDMTKPGSSGQGQDSLMGTPVPVFPGQPALQTFGVAEEENSASFLAKADRYYEVSTTKLAPGVDTVLTISLEDGPTYTNDDAAAGTLASKITFQAPPANAVVRIRVKNLGEFGPERTYQLLVKEVVPKAGTTEDEQATSPTQSPDAEDSSGHVITIATPTPSPVPTLGSDDGIVEFAILVEVKPQVP